MNQKMKEREDTQQQQEVKAEAYGANQSSNNEVNHLASQPIESIYNLGQNVQHEQNSFSVPVDQHPAATFNQQHQNPDLPAESPGYKNAPIQSITNPNLRVFKQRSEHDSHQCAIVGSNNLASNITSYEMKQMEKEQKRKNFADELKKQIEERDFIRKKEEYRATKATSFMKDQVGNPEGGANVQQQQPQAPEGTYQTFYGNETKGHSFDPRITKQDFPDIKTKARVLDNRVDLHLERNGNILNGRDERTLLQQKREQEQQAVKAALQQQIDEKRHKKDQELLRRKAEDMRDEMRVKDEMRTMAIAEGQVSMQAPGQPTAPQTFYNENSMKPVEMMNSMS